jgi:hypothetical protein
MRAKFRFKVESACVERENFRLGERARRESLATDSLVFARFRSARVVLRGKL